MTSKLVALLSSENQKVLKVVESHAATLLDCSPRFRYFTLHGKQHIQNLFRIADILIEGGLHLNQEQAFFLALSICVHDLGMVVPLSSMDYENVLGGRPQVQDPANLELLIRDLHHELVDEYIERHYDFLLGLGVTAPQCAMIRDVSRAHRKTDLTEFGGQVRSLGALLRLIDELDTYPSRAPAQVLLDTYKEMDATSCWHWFKHNICHEWMIGHNVTFNVRTRPRVEFRICVHPPRKESIPYWLNQIRRPLHRVLRDEWAGGIIRDSWGIDIDVETSASLSSAISLGEEWLNVERKATSAGRKTILVIDDEVRKMEDLFLGLMRTYYVMFSPNAQDAIEKLGAARVDLAIIDLQIGSGSRWEPEETQDFKMTGLKLCQEISQHFPETKMGILTGSRYDLSELRSVNSLEFLLKKPVDPEDFEREVLRVLG